MIFGWFVFSLVLLASVFVSWKDVRFALQSTRSRDSIGNDYGMIGDVLGFDFLCALFVHCDV